jgi:hypothetical protein
VRNTDRPNNNNIQQRSHFISAAAAQLFPHLFAAAVFLSTFFKRVLISRIAQINHERLSKRKSATFGGHFEGLQRAKQRKKSVYSIEPIRVIVET